MICCLNPDCLNPQNPDGTNFCLSCETELVSLLRNRYRIIQPLGRGGFACTYLAEDVDKLNEQCVVKQLVRSQFYGSGSSKSPKKATELFEQEAKRLQELGKHDQIPTLFAYFKENNYLYLVQEFIEGQNLLQELKQQGIFDETKIRQLLNDLLPVLELIHQQQIIHRDIKPENIIHRQRDGKYVLIDFGISKQKTELIKTTPGTIIGSLGYGAMEQIQFGEAYPSSDLYSLGITCFDLLTNIPPFQLWSKQGFSWTSNWHSQLTQVISPELRQIMDKLLQENHEQRYQSAREVLQELTFLRASHSNIPHTIISSQQILQPQLQIQKSNSSPTSLQLSMQKLMPGVLTVGSGGSLLAIALISFIGTSLISYGLWLLVLGILLFTQSRSLFEKTYLLIVAIITNLFLIYIFHVWQINNPFNFGINGLIVIVLLVILGGVLGFMLLMLSQIFDKLINKYF
ncbi:serine/threonine protein kinase [Nostoc sp. FACHB-152]|uniref:serine/threonine-protein kinase n=1 Tax=unclassified Nostoc TaxID=2593658 RepID=UPI00168293E3|nr:MULTISPECIES: serine/threonine-protein kinase [unclassified Nostoc]MBD2448311.1 serine/threonine protein kinase [Nostoc sp. FACHB-152]MBD2467473.1 serine/threonine protein kinase [Nostoc sp. FACHB-145]